MKKLISNGWLAVIVIVSLLVIDQVIKIGVKTNMYLYESIRITDWFYIHFIENNGMAYGMTFVNKLVLSTFRIVAVAVILYYLRGQILKGARTGYIVCLSMVVAGAAGNIFDSMFYGLVFSASSPFYVSYLFFSPVFNFADASICVAVALLLLFYRKELSQINLSLKKSTSENAES